VWECMERRSEGVEEAGEYRSGQVGEMPRILEDLT